ncbi:MAG: translation elongation factor Ts [Elusimicrobiota bacterium]
MEIKAQDVQKLRERTGVGMMECRNALKDANGNIDKAIDLLRERGIAKAAKRADRTAREGRIISYIHPGDKLGAIVEINCETDFVARTAEFGDLGREIAMQVAAAQPIYVTSEDVPQEEIEKEKKILMKQVEDSGKPAQVVEKIVSGKINKYFEEVCLMDQVYIKDSGKKIKDLVNEYRAKIGENVQIRRFACFKLGEK